MWIEEELIAQYFMREVVVTMSESEEKDLQNLKAALQKKDIAIHSYTEQIRAFNDPQINALLEGILHNEMRRKVELEEQIERMQVP